METKLCPVCKEYFSVTVVNKAYCSSKCNEIDKARRRRVNKPNPKFLNELLAEWLPEQKRLEKAGILVNWCSEQRTVQNELRIIRNQQKK